MVMVCTRTSVYQCRWRRKQRVTGRHRQQKTTVRASAPSAPDPGPRGRCAREETSTSSSSPPKPFLLRWAFPPSRASSTSELDVSGRRRALVRSFATAGTLLVCAKLTGVVSGLPRTVEPIFFASLDGGMSSPTYYVDIDEDGRKSRSVLVPAYQRDPSTGRMRRETTTLRISVDPIGNEVLEDVEGNMYFDLGAENGVVVVSAETGEVYGSRYKSGAGRTVGASPAIVDKRLGNLSQLHVVREGADSGGGGQLRAFFSDEISDEEETGDNDVNKSVAADELLQEYRNARLGPDDIHHPMRKEEGRKAQDEQDVAGLYAALSKLVSEGNEISSMSSSPRVGIVKGIEKAKGERAITDADIRAGTVIK